MRIQALSTPAILALADGSLFYGTAIGADGETSGEVVFNTAMTGYQEILTDPSYCRQLVTLTYPQIGNTGVNGEDNESERVWADGLLCVNFLDESAVGVNMPRYLISYTARTR